MDIKIYFYNNVMRGIKMYQGSKVRLREYRREDAYLAQKYMNDAEIKMLLAPGIPFPITFEEEEKWVMSNVSSKNEYSFAIETLEDNKYIGGCGINALDWKNSIATVGIFIGDKNYWSMGYGTDAMKVLINFIFNEMNINKIKLNVYSFNKRAVKSYEKCGFKIEGTLRQEIFRNGQYHDEYVMGLLREEFI